ncbi:hypothetical protein KKP97_06780 [Methanothermococcus sp. SCGC AD-155-C09]|nr:hypothetical protein [Methanothermococcus sp. SCGC AD-155-C09]MBW9222731.1 hypothetical protein [Methanothermococcus sp. SCGC AD-155-C09]
MDLNCPYNIILIIFIVACITLVVFQYSKKEWIKLPYQLIIDRIFIFSLINVIIGIASGIFSCMISKSDPIGAYILLGISTMILMTNSIVVVLCNNLYNVKKNISNEEIPIDIRLKEDLGILFIASLLIVVAIILYVII